jgi:hypothetical protein
MKETIYSKKFKEISQVSLVVSENSLRIVTDEGDIELSDHHDQDCCENVYADWSVAENYKDQLKSKYSEIEIRGVADDGFIIAIGGYYTTSLTKIFIPCYNSQNGYYGSGLTLEIKENGKTKTHDISEYVEDRID